MAWTSLFHNAFTIFLNGLIISFVFLKAYIFVLVALAVLCYFTKTEWESVDVKADKPPHARI